MLVEEIGLCLVSGGPSVGRGEEEELSFFVCAAQERTLLLHWACQRLIGRVLLVGIRVEKVCPEETRNAAHALPESKNTNIKNNLGTE